MNECPECGRQLPTDYRLYQHLRLSHGKFVTKESKNIVQGHWRRTKNGQLVWVHAHVHAQIKMTDEEQRRWVQMIALTYFANIVAETNGRDFNLPEGMTASDAAQIALSMYEEIKADEGVEQLKATLEQLAKETEE